MTQIVASHLFSKQGKLLNVAVVGALHLGAIYTLLVALDVVPNPVRPVPPVDFTIIDQPKPKVDPVDVTGTGPTFRHPVSPRRPIAPVIRSMDSPKDATNTEREIAIRPPTDVPPLSGASSPLRGITSTHTVPPYPPLAMRLGYQGSVRLQVSVDDHGKVVGAVIETSSGHADLDAAAVSWVETQWRYEPAMKNGQPVAANTSVVVTFQLKRAR